MDLLGKIQTSQKESKEAMEHKAQEYKKLAAQLETLTDAVSKLTTVTQTLQINLTATQKEIAAISTKGEEAIAPLKATVATLKEQISQTSKEINVNIEDAIKPLNSTVDILREEAVATTQRIEEAGRAAEKKIRDGKPYDRNIYELLLEGAIRIGYVFVFTFLALWVFGIMDMKDDIAYNRDRIDAIHYNQAYGSHYSPFDMREFYKAWDNQREYLKNERQKAAEQGKR